MNMNSTNISENIKYIGADDKTIDLFESQYIVPNGMAYNSYVIFDEKIAVMDTVDKRAGEEWLKNLETALDGKAPDYLVVLHMEPDHSANIKGFAEKYKDAKIIGNPKTFAMIGQFFDIDLTDRFVTVNDGDKIDLGQHKLNFITAPMVHWPEVMLAYEESEKILFSADAFGKFGALDCDEDWACEARRYYFNIVGKYGAQVQTLLGKAKGLDINCICPLHGPILKENLGYYINLYDIWSSYEPEDKGVFIAYASIHGNTKIAAEKMADILREKGCEKVVVTDLARSDWAEAVEDAFRYDRMILAGATYEGGVFPPMSKFLYHLKAKSYQKRSVGLIENGSWGPVAARVMKKSLEEMKDIKIYDTVVTIKSAVKEKNISDMEKLADEVLKG